VSAAAVRRRPRGPEKREASSRGGDFVSHFTSTAAIPIAASLVGGWEAGASFRPRQEAIMQAGETKPRASEAGAEAGRRLVAGWSCAESVLGAVAQRQGVDSEWLPAIATGFCAGVSRRGGMCGAVSGAAMAISMVKGRRSVGDSREPTYGAVQALVDGADSNFAVYGLNYLQKATRLYSARLADVALSEVSVQHGLSLPAVSAESRVWYNPDLVSQRFMVPAVMGVLLLVTTMIVTSMALVKEREEGTMEQIIVTPLRPAELIAGKLLPFVAIGFVEISLALPVMLFVFHVPLEGSLALLYLLSGLFLLTTLGLGLFVSTLVKTQQQATMVAAFFVMMPFVLLSGFIFPIENMPAPIRAMSYVIPLRYYLVIVRGIFLKGTGWAELWGNAVMLLALGLTILAMAVVKFRKRLD